MSQDLTGKTVRITDGPHAGNIGYISAIYYQQGSMSDDLLMVYLYGTDAVHCTLHPPQVEVLPDDQQRGRPATFLQWNEVDICQVVGNHVAHLVGSLVQEFDSGVNVTDVRIVGLDELDDETPPRHKQHAVRVTLIGGPAQTERDAIRQRLSSFADGALAVLDWIETELGIDLDETLK